jgi:beta-xylosidase
VKLGTETNGGFRNINISGIVVKPSSDQQEKFFGQWIGSSAISLEIVDGGVLENVNVSDVTIEGTESPIFIRLGNRGRGYLSDGKDMEKIVPVDHVGRIKGIHLDNIQIRHAGSMGCSITGLPGYPVEDVWLSNITLHHQGGVTVDELAHINDTIKDEKEKAYPEATMWGNLPAKGFFVRHVRNVHFSNVVVATEQPDVRPDIVRVDAEPLAWGDQGDGTYVNPVLNADFSDPDVIRVGEKYYMVASDFHFMGMQVLESDDMVNWRYVSQIYHRLDEPGWNENKHYAGGSWAPAIRYHNGLFYVFFCTPEEGLYMSTAKDAHGPWAPLHLVKRVEKWEDPCPFWDEDGQAYLGRSQHGAGPIIVHRMSPDGKRLLDEGVTVYTGPVAEGTKFLKRHGWYYLIIPEGGVGQGWQTVLRARNIYGPYERQVVLEQGSTSVNGPHQGALVDTPDGQWWFYHFQETPVLGRVVHLQPACWQDDWLQVGVDLDGNGIGEPMHSWQKPISSHFSGTTLQIDDDFSDTLGLQWQWNHNPDDAHWSLSERKGWLTLRALPADSLKACRNMLTQKVVGFQSESTTLMTAKGDCYAGIFCSGKQFRGVGLCPQGIFVEVNGERQIAVKGSFSQLYLRVRDDCQTNSHQFFYSLDGVSFIPVGDVFSMRSGYWKGIRVGLFCYGMGGKAQFDKFEQVIKK